MSCGLCAKPIAIGGPIQEIQVGWMKRKLIRCEVCADGQAPPDLPERVTLSPSTKRMQPIRKLVTTWVDYKAKQGQA
jgi:hypothetical protein